MSLNQILFTCPFQKSLLATKLFIIIKKNFVTLKYRSYFPTTNIVHNVSPYLCVCFHRKLESLDLSYNQMAVVPTDLPRALRHLSLQHNHIHSIPPYSLSHLRPGLQTLRLSHNLLEEHTVLGKSFRGVYQTLIELHLDNNRFERVPHNMRHFKKLQMLHLDHNRIRYAHLSSLPYLVSFFTL